MTSFTTAKPTEAGVWTKVWHGFRAFDEAIHHDPAETLHRRAEGLEKRLSDLERSQAG